MSAYTSLAQAAARLIEAYGEKVTATITGAAQYDPATGEAVGVKTSATGDAFQRDFSAQEAAQGTLILEGDKRVILPAAKWARPPVGAMLTIGADEWRILGVREVGRTGEPVIYVLQARR